MLPAVGRYLKWIGAPAIVCALGLACVLAVQSGDAPGDLADLTAATKTVCVGRFLIDVPEAARVTMKMANLDGFDVTRQEETAKQFEQWLAERESTLGAAPNMLGRKNIELSKELGEPGVSGKVLVHTRYRSYDMRNGQRVYHETVTVEGHVHKNGVTFSFSSDGDAPERAAVVSSLMRQLVLVRQGDIPQAPGFCLDNGLITDPSLRERHESVTMFAGFPGHPDISLAFWTNTGLHRGPGLVARDAAATDARTLARSRTLRTGARTIGGFVGEEIGIETTELNLTTNLSFAWETNGSQDKVLMPRLLLELDTGLSPRTGGKPVSSSLKEESAMQLWDSISSSVRLRPTAITGLARLDARGRPPATCTGAAMHRPAACRP